MLVEGTARRLAADETAVFDGRFHYRFWAFVYRVFYRDVPVSYEVRPLPGGQQRN